MKWTLVISVMLSVFAAHATAQIVGFVESFSGQGSFQSNDGTLIGLDNPGWVIDPGGSLSDDGYVFSVESPRPLESTYHDLTRIVTGQGSYTNEIHIEDLHLGRRGSVVMLEHYFDLDTNVLNRAYAYLSWPTEPSGMWRFGLSTPSNGITSVFVPPSDEVILGVQYDSDSAIVTASYRLVGAAEDDVTELAMPMPVEMSSESVVRFHIGSEGIGTLSGIISEWSLMSQLVITGDFDANGIMNVDDLDLLSRELQKSEADVRFDITDDTVVDHKDLDAWVHDVKHIFYGDADLDGEFSTADLINVFQAGEYEDEIADNSTWLTGDWNADGEFTTSDLVVAFQDGGYEQGPREDIAVVPDAHRVSKIWLGAVAAAGAAWRRQRRNAMSLGGAPAR